MGDLIDRQAAIDALNKLKIYRPLDSDRYVISDCLNKIANLPSAQSEIVRCKDCKWKQGSECARFAEVRPFPDDFCSRAERRTDGSNR